MYSYLRAVQYLFGEDSWLLEQDNRRGNQLAEASFYLAKGHVRKFQLTYYKQTAGIRAMCICVGHRANKRKLSRKAQQNKISPFHE